jgi:hypothetical protein
MRKLTGLFAFILLMAGCQKSATTEDQLEVTEVETAVTKRNCSSYDVLQSQLAADPELAGRMQQIEEFTKNAIANGSTARLLAGGVIEIPVIFNVLYKTTIENISNEQLQSQIDVLNEDFAGSNADYDKTPNFLSLRAGNTKIKFVLAGINRKSTNKKSWTTNNAMKSSTQGGIDATTPTTHLNVWVCNMGGGILGYAQFPGGNAATDGIVLDNNATGRIGSLYSAFNLGRTATHEVGHWLNLRHIWGDATCGDDEVSDTPKHNAANTGCPSSSHASTCSGAGLEMWMNYMDYTNDACMYMFSIGQKERMAATFLSNGGRYSFAQ